MLITLGLINDNADDSELHGSNVDVFATWQQKERDVLSLFAA